MLEKYGKLRAKVWKRAGINAICMLLAAYVALDSAYRFGSNMTLCSSIDLTVKEIERSGLE